MGSTLMAQNLAHANRAGGGEPELSGKGSVRAQNADNCYKNRGAP
jgi:hypothetical protein